ncbi:hypothetical protein PG985_015015 [Apiospora marii]|uniref:SNF2 N-terminal domain-containing protein n=1 Tax=Apiospora marii TaxID=335849 RepID=A0ABR1RLI5_9PEZI
MVFVSASSTSHATFVKNRKRMHARELTAVQRWQVELPLFKARGQDDNQLFEVLDLDGDFSLLICDECHVLKDENGEPRNLKAVLSLGFRDVIVPHIPANIDPLYLYTYEIPVRLHKPNRKVTLHRGLEQALLLARRPSLCDPESHDPGVRFLVEASNADIQLWKLSHP